MRGGAKSAIEPRRSMFGRVRDAHGRWSSAAESSRSVARGHPGGGREPCERDRTGGECDRRLPFGATLQSRACTGGIQARCGSCGARIGGLGVRADGAGARIGVPGVRICVPARRPAMSRSADLRSPGAFVRSRGAGVRSRSTDRRSRLACCPVPASSAAAAWPWQRPSRMSSTDREPSQGATIIPLPRPKVGQGVPGPGKPRLLDRVGACLYARHYSKRTVRAYLGWIRRFILYHGKRHPDEMGGPEVGAFLSHPKRKSAHRPRIKLWPHCSSFISRYSGASSNGWETWFMPSSPAGFRSYWGGKKRVTCWRGSRAPSGWCAPCCTGEGYACWKPYGCAPKTSTSIGGRSSSGGARAAKTGGPSCPAPCWSRCGPIWRASRPGTKPT